MAGSSTLGSLAILGSGGTIVGGTLAVQSDISLTSALTESSANLIENGNLVNNGSITLDPSTLTVEGSLTGTGVVTLETGSTLDVLGDISAGQTIVFDGTDAVLQITDSASIAGTFSLIGNFATIDITDLPLASISSASFDSTTDLLGITYVGASSPLALSFVSTAPFILTNDGAGGTDIEIPCFAGGTRLLSIDGDILVEDIKPGDILVTVRDGGPVSQAVVWTGRRTINIARHPQPELVRPVRIIAGAFGPGVPERDLRLSPEHAIYVDGALFTAISLVNGNTIYQETRCTHVTYHHIELTSHDVVLAEGLPCESFLDTGNRAMFDTVSGLMALHPDFTPLHEAGFCAPLVREGAALNTLRARLAQRLARHAA